MKNQIKSKFIVYHNKEENSVSIYVFTERIEKNTFQEMAWKTKNVINENPFLKIINVKLEDIFEDELIQDNIDFFFFNDIIRNEIGMEKEFKLVYPFKKENSGDYLYISFIDEEIKEKLKLEGFV